MPAFRIDPSPTFRATVLLSVPGRAEKAPLDFVFRHRGKDALKGWLASSSGRDDRDFLADVIESWGSVEDDGGAPVPYSADSLAQLLDSYPSSGSEIFDAYIKELHGARAKN